MASRSTKRPGRPRTTAAVFTGVALVLASTWPAAWAVDHADAAQTQPKRAQQTQTQPNVTPSQAARRAGDKYGGKVLNVVLEHGPGGPYYQVKLLDHGSVRVVHIEARR